MNHELQNFVDHEAIVWLCWSRRLTHASHGERMPDDIESYDEVGAPMESRSMKSWMDCVEGNFIKGHEPEENICEECQITIDDEVY